MPIENEASYISLRKSLDSLRDVVLTDYSLFETAAEKKHFSDTVTKKIMEFLQFNSKKNQTMWDQVSENRAKAHSSHAQSLMQAREMPVLCPPGFREENGLCVPI
jgi:hypothetical protein